MITIQRFHVYHPLTDITLFACIGADDGSVKLIQIQFGIQTTSGALEIKTADHPIVKRWARLIEGFLDIQNRDLSEIAVSLDWCTPFQRTVLTATRSIPWATTVSYSELARISGYPRAVRAVATVMRHNRFPLVIPCHRVIKKNGSCGGFSGCSKGQMVQLKRKLLENEARV